MGVPKVWIYDDPRLKIDRLQPSGYVQVTTSPTFPGLDLPEKISPWVQQAFRGGTSTMLKVLRQRLSS